MTQTKIPNMLRFNDATKRNHRHFQKLIINLQEKLNQLQDNKKSQVNFLWVLYTVELKEIN